MRRHCDPKIVVLSLDVLCVCFRYVCNVPRNTKKKKVWLSIGKRRINISSVDPEIIPYNLTNSLTLPLYHIRIDLI